MALQLQADADPGISDWVPLLVRKGNGFIGGIGILALGNTESIITGHNAFLIDFFSQPAQVAVPVFAGPRTETLGLPMFIQKPDVFLL